MNNYEIYNFHFHTPSEHTKNGTHYDAEIHFVTNKSLTEFLVIGIFFDIDEG